MQASKKRFIIHPLTLFNYMFLTLAGIMTLYPFWYIFMFALSTYSDVVGKGAILIPHGFTLTNLEYVIKQPRILSAYQNTIFVVVAGTLLSLTLTAIFSYPLSKSINGSRLIQFIVYLTLLFGGGMIPTYLIVKNTGLLDSLWALIIPKLLNAFYVFLMINFFRTIPSSLIESARIDGASEMTILRIVVIPLSLPVMATIALFYAVEYWNSFFDAVIYIKDPSKWTLQVILRELLIANEADLFTGSGVQNTSGDQTAAAVTGESIRMALVLVAVVPVMIIYPFLQKYFVKGVMIGAVKG
jgi:putative aldouronate transport system permease protein